MNRGERRRETRSRQASSVPPLSLAETAYRRGIEAASRGELVEAKRHLERCLSIETLHTEARHDLAVVVLKGGEPAAAVAQFEQVLARQPSHVGASMNLALALCELGDGDGAVRAVSRAAALAPRSAAVHAVMGHALALTADLTGAEAAYRRSLDLDGSAVSVMARHADVLRRMTCRHASLAAYDRLIEFAPRNLTAQAEILLLLSGTASDRETEAARGLASLAASDKRGLRDLCARLAEDGRLTDALVLADAVVAGNPDIADFLADRASLLHALGRMAEALADLKCALSLDPADTDVLFCIGRLFEYFDQPLAAAPFFLQAIEHRPDHADAYVRLANVKSTLGDVCQSVTLLRHALTIDPGRLTLYVDLCWNRLLACDWEGLDVEVAQIIEKHIKAGEPFEPFMLLALGLPPDQLLLWTRAWAERKLAMATARCGHGARKDRRRDGGRIRIGYLSADFKNHATLLLMAELFELHDRRSFELFGYNIGVVDDSYRCRRAIGAFDHFIDLATLKDAVAAERITADGIDILIDLKGCTAGGRPDILVHRPAPIQVNYLGYPGSLGMSGVDYMIADAVVVPDEHRPFYDEAVVHLPYSYQPNDRRRAGADPTASRGAHGLPEDGFVFCCFNNTYKMTPLVFDIWMRLMDGIPGSVIWLLSSNHDVQANLCREARARGIPSERLIFAPRVGFEDHIGRMALADLFLDTLPYGAHTTASDALWAGLPVLTCLGSHFAGRVAASLLTAIGLPELITTSLAEYEREASALARDPARLEALRERLAANRFTAPLFDTPRYVRHYEAALERMLELYHQGKPPEPFAIADIPSYDPEPERMGAVISSTLARAC